MDDLSLKRVLFEWLRDRLKEQALAKIVSLNILLTIQRTYLFFKYWFLFYLYEPLPRVLPASGVVTRFKKDYPRSDDLEKLPDPLNI
jgi:hypothetical protein